MTHLLALDGEDERDYLGGSLMLPGAIETDHGVGVIEGTLSYCRECGEGIYADDRGDGTLIWCHDHGSTVCHDTPAGSVEDGPVAVPDGRERERTPTPCPTSPSRLHVFRGRPSCLFCNLTPKRRP